MFSGTCFKPQLKNITSGKWRVSQPSVEKSGATDPDPGREHTGILLKDTVKKKHIHVLH